MKAYIEKYNIMVRKINEIIEKLEVLEQEDTILYMDIINRIENIDKIPDGDVMKKLEELEEFINHLKGLGD